MIEIDKYGDLSPRDLEMAGLEEQTGNTKQKSSENNTYADITPGKKLSKTIKNFSRENQNIFVIINKIRQSSRYDHYGDENDIRRDKERYDNYYHAYDLIDKLDYKARIYIKEKKLERKLSKRNADAPKEARFIQEQYMSMLERLGNFLETIMAMSSLEFETHLEVIDETYQTFVDLRHEFDIIMERKK